MRVLLVKCSVAVVGEICGTGGGIVERHGKGHRRGRMAHIDGAIRLRKSIGG